jgi:hypothetical protein
VQDVFQAAPAAVSAEVGRAVKAVEALADTFLEMQADALLRLGELLGGRLSAMLQQELGEAEVGASYLLDDAEFAQNQSNDPWVGGLLRAVATVLAPYRARLAKPAAAALNTQLVQGLCTALEAAVHSKGFNQLGGLQFDKELRALIQVRRAEGLG